MEREDDGPGVGVVGRGGSFGRVVVASGDSSPTMRASRSKGEEPTKGSSIGAKNAWPLRPPPPGLGVTGVRPERPPDDRRCVGVPNGRPLNPSPRDGVDVGSNGGNPSSNGSKPPGVRRMRESRDENELNPGVEGACRRRSGVSSHDDGRESCERVGLGDPGPA